MGLSMFSPEQQPVSLSPIWSKSIRVINETIATRLPPWFSKIKDPRQQKLFFRSWMACWLCIVLMLPSGSLVIVGNSVFFAAIVCILTPPNLPIQPFLMASVTLVITCATFSAWACAALRASYITRDQALYARTVERLTALQGRELNSTDIQYYAVHGEFLDGRASGVFAVFVGLGTFAIGYARASSPKLVIPTTVASIIFDVLSTTGVQLPTPAYNLLESYAISAAYYLAISFVLIIVVFPQTLNHEWLQDAGDLIGAATALVELQEQVLASNPASLNSLLTEKLRSRADVLAKLSHALKTRLPLLHTEFSYGQFGPADLEKLRPSFSLLGTRCTGLLSFSTLLASAPRPLKLDEPVRHDQNESTEVVYSIRSRRSDGFRFSTADTVISDTKTDVQEEVGLEELIPALRSSTSRLRSAVVRGLKVADHRIRLINTRRWKRSLYGTAPIDIEAQDANAEKALQEVMKAIDIYHNSERLALFDALPDALHTACEPSTHLPPLFTCFVFQSNLLWTAKATAELLATLSETQRKHPHSRIWIPTRLSRISEYLWSDDDENDATENPDAQPTAEILNEDYFAEGIKKDPDCLPPDTVPQKIGATLHRLSYWLIQRRTVYALKYMILSLAMWSPTVFKHSAYFYMSNRGVWAMIIAQLTSGVYVSDQVSVLKSRIVGTAIGALMGLLAWYVGNGRGNGNPYGMAASSLVFIGPMVFYRLFGPVPLEGMVAGVTTVIIVGYSWVDSHGMGLAVTFGHGWQIAWRRTLLVLIGSTASSLLMFLPPQSLRRDIRKTNTANIKEISRLYSTLLSTWLADIDENDGSVSLTGAPAESVPMQFVPTNYLQWAPTFRARLGKLTEMLPHLRAQTLAARREGSTRGRWPFEKYKKLVDIQSAMVIDLVQLGAALRHLNPRWRRMLIHHAPFLNPSLISDVMAVFAVVAMSLDTGEAIHEVLPRNLLERSQYHHTMRPYLPEPRSRPVSRAPSIVNGKSRHSLDRNRYMSPEFALYATGCSAAYQILIGVDELHKVTRELCGEVPLRGFAHWMREFELRQLDQRV